MSDTVELTHTDVELAASELSQRTGVSYGDIMTAARERVGGEGDEVSLAHGLASVYQTLQSEGMVSDSRPFHADDPGGGTWTEDGIWHPDEPLGLTAHDVVRLTGEVPDESELVILRNCRDARIARMFTDGTPDQRRQQERNLVALANGRTPHAVDDFPELDDYFGMGGVDSIVARHPGLFAASTGHANGSNHTQACPDDCPTDHRAPKRGGLEHPEIDAVVRRNPEVFAESKSAQARSEAYGPGKR